MSEREEFISSTGIDVLNSIAAVQNLATAFRDREFWEPRFRVRPTHFAMYLNYGKNTEFLCDMEISMLGQYYDQAFNADPDQYAELWHISFDELTGAAEWVPAIGPAPVWSHPTAALTHTRMEMAALVADFVRENF
jgi:hypothetical protein